MDEGIGVIFVIYLLVLLKLHSENMKLARENERMKREKEHQMKGLKQYRK